LSAAIKVDNATFVAARLQNGDTRNNGSWRITEMKDSLNKIVLDFSFLEAGLLICLPPSPPLHDHLEPGTGGWLRTGWCSPASRSAMQVVATLKRSKELAKRQEGYSGKTLPTARSCWAWRTARR